MDKIRRPRNYLALPLFAAVSNWSGHNRAGSPLIEERERERVQVREYLVPETRGDTLRYEREVIGLPVGEDALQQEYEDDEEERGKQVLA